MIADLIKKAQKTGLLPIRIALAGLLLMVIFGNCIKRSPQPEVVLIMLDRDTRTIEAQYVISPASEPCFENACLHFIVNNSLANAEPKPSSLSNDQGLSIKDWYLNTKSFVKTSDYQVSSFVASAEAAPILK